MANQQQQMDAAQINAIARQLIRKQSVRMTQPIFSQSYSAVGTSNISSSQPVVNVIPRNVGLITGFWVKVAATISNDSGQTATPSDFGPANILSQIQFNDLQNNTRIQTTGWHLALLNAIKGRRPFDSALSNTALSTPIAYGANWTDQIQATASIADSATGTVVMWYWVPLAYSHDDLRGAVYANVVNATMQLNLTFNTAPCANAGADSTSSVYKLGTSGTNADCRISAATVTVDQEYLDQLPVGKAGVLLPILDLATIYEMKNTALSSIVSGTDFPIQYSNFRDFLSTVLIYVNTGSSGARGVGADINYWALQSANFTNIYKYEPGLAALKTRQHLQTDLPPGVYYFGSREKPISTVQYGNMQMILNAVTANAGAYVLAGFEDFALVQTLSMAGSLTAS